MQPKAPAPWDVGVDSYRSVSAVCPMPLEYLIRNEPAPVQVFTRPEIQGKILVQEHGILES
jgi:hypothetical protein